MAAPAAAPKADVAQKTSAEVPHELDAEGFMLTRLKLAFPVVATQESA